jgi:putative ATPase
LARAAGGDARQALVDLEALTAASGDRAWVGVEDLLALLPSRPLRHDRDGGDHHDVLSALIKSLRGSDPDAALYWLARLIRGGEDGRAILRRLMIFAAEDVGNADPRALGVAVDGAQAFERIGMPEGRIVLGQVVTWLATCPKSNAAYLAIDAALAEVDRSGALGVPEPLRNTPGLGDRQAYRYPHDFPDALVEQAYLPEALRGVTFYAPTARGAEKLIRERQAWWRARLARRVGDWPADG